jgi:predicted ATP-grasp superfamily ATP-dependent carboligase
LRLWDPLRDILALRELREKKQITVGRWLRSVMHRQTFPFFSWSDPMPALMRVARPLSRLWPRRPAQTALKSSTLFADMPTNSPAPATDPSVMPIVGK